MAIAKYKYSATIVSDWTSHSLAPGESDGIQKDLEGYLGILFQIWCSYGSGATKGVEVKVLQSPGLSTAYDTSDSAVLAFEMPYLAGATRIMTIPILLPGVGPKIQLDVSNDTGDAVSVTVKSRLIEGVEIL